MYKMLLIFLVSILLAVPSFPQNEPDTVETEDDWDDWEEWEDEGEWSEDFHTNIFNLAGAPTISVNYGLTKLEHKNLAGSFGDPRSIQLKIGYTDIDQVWQTRYILETSQKYISVTNMTTDLADISPSSADYETNNWRIGLGRGIGYGYEFGQSALIFTSETSLDWTRIKMLETPGDTNDRNLTNLFNNTFRFGNSFEGNVRFQIIRNLNIDAGYERSVIYPRHLFWKWLGSVAIEGAAQWMVDRFVEEILDSSPYFVPVMSFLLKNGLNYGLYELRKEKMNWPFNSTAPLTYDQFKFGITFVF